MPYLDCAYFSDKLLYKILFVSSYGLKDINFASFKHFLEFYSKTEVLGASGTEAHLARDTDARVRTADWMLARLPEHLHRRNS
jgi:hypothetical protein